MSEAPDVAPGQLAYRSLGGETCWWFHGGPSKEPGFLSIASDLDVMNVWLQGYVAIGAAIREMDRRGFSLPTRLEVPDASH